MYRLYNGYGGWDVGGMMGFLNGGIMMIIFWVLFAFLVIWIVREIKNSSSQSKSSDSRALDILKERYVKGEIDKKEFEEKKKDLDA